MTEGPSKQQEQSRDTVRHPRKLAPGQRISLQHLDTLTLCKVPGVGRYFARRIVDYGRRLGGYTRVDQLLEIEGFPESALPFFSTEGVTLRRIEVNKQSLATLRQHPYVNFYQAREIVSYRRLHGPLRNIDDLRILKEFSAEDIERLKPYLSFQ